MRDVEDFAFYQVPGSLSLNESGLPDMDADLLVRIRYIVRRQDRGGCYACIQRWQQMSRRPSV